jgi:hypothetical protein
MRRFCGNASAAFLLASAASFLAGCGKTSDVTGVGAVTQQTADDIAVEVGEAASAEGGGLMIEIEGARSTLPHSIEPAGIESAVARDTTLARGPFTLSLERAFFDVDDNALQPWDPTAVRAVVHTWLRGTVTSVRYRATRSRAGTLGVRGLAPAVDTLVFEGSASDTTEARYTSLDGSRTTDVRVLATRTLAGVRALEDRGVHPWPLGGTATWNLSVEKFANTPRGGIEARIEAVVVVAFDGTPSATAAVNGRFRYRLNLQTGDAVRI